MAQVQTPNSSSTTAPPKQEALDVAFTGFLTYKAPFETPTLELKHELDCSLNDIIDVFKSMVFEDAKSLSDEHKDLTKFSSRKMIFSQKSSGNQGVFSRNKSGHLCEVMKFETTLLPLIPGFDSKEYEKRLKEKEAEQKDADDEWMDGWMVGTAESKSGWKSWTSVNSWKDWGKSLVNPQAWGSSMEDWLKYFNMKMQAEELWKVDCTEKKAISIVKNTTMNWMVGVYEYWEIEQVNGGLDDANEEKKNENESNGDKLVFVKKLYVWPIVPVPAFVLRILKDQYKKDSQGQMQIITNLISNRPLNEPALLAVK